MCLGNSNQQILFDNLERPLDFDSIDSTLWSDKCDYYEINDIPALNSKNKNLIVLQLNIRSLLNKQIELNLLINKLHKNKSLPKIILLSETHLTESKLRHVNLPNYSLIYHNRTNKSGGGVAIAIHNTLRFKENTQLSHLNNENFEGVFIELRQKSFKPIMIGSIYRPPNTNNRNFLNHYKQMIDLIKKDNITNIILGMDHNLDLLKATSHKITQEFIDLNFNNNLLPCITRPTRITKASATLIDNIFVSQDLHKSFDSGILIHDLSDHMPSILNIHSQKCDNNQPLEFSYRTLNKTSNMKQLNYMLQSIDWNTLNKTDVNIAFRELQTTIENCLDIVAPLKHCIIPEHKIWKAPWITKGLSNSMNKCNTLYKTYLKSNSTNRDEEKYKKYRNNLTKIKRNARVKYYTQQCYTLKSNMSKLWQLINDVIKKTNDKTGVIDYITIDNIKYYDTNIVSNRFASFYSKLGENLTKSIKSKHSTSYYLKKISTNSKTLFLYDITSSEIKKHIDRLPAKNSSGYDNISNKLLKNIKYSIICPLLHIFNLSLRQGIFPDAMKVSEIIPLFKKGQKDLMVNYRPISLLITLSKILEKCMYSRIYKFVINNNIFYNKQYGFRSGHSCEQAIQNLYGHILQNKDNGIKTAAIYLDLSKAFDTITHNLLLEKLDKYGVRGVSNNWIKSYLSDRLIQVKCRTLSCNTSKISNQYKINQGTPQGSCLGPLLFNLYCNDLYLNVEHCNLIMFADDTTLYASHRNTTYLNHILQHDLLNLENWFAGNKLLLNVSKTYGMKFWDNPISKTIEFSLNLDGKPIPLVTNTKFLGVTIDNNLTWTKHINNIIAKISANKNLIGKSRNLLSTHAKNSVYYAHIYSHLAYAITVWGNSVTSKQKKILKLYKNIVFELYQINQKPIRLLISLKVSEL